MSAERAIEAYDKMAAMFPANRPDMTAEIWADKLTGLDVETCGHTVDAILAELRFFPSWHEFKIGYDAQRIAVWNNRTFANTGTICGFCGARGSDHRAWCDGSQPVRAPGQRGEINARLEWSQVVMHPKDGQRGHDMNSHGRDATDGRYQPLTAEHRAEMSEIIKAGRARCAAKFGHAGNV